MRNLKKVLSLALALVMLVGMMVVGAGATSFADDASIQNQEAVSVLAGLGVVKGRDDGSNFDPTGTLTRAEAAMMIAQLDLGVDAAAALTANGINSFSDVATTHWAVGAIDYCVEQGYIRGDGNGHFFPGNNVTGVEFGIMLTSLLGYDADAEGVTGAQWATKGAALARRAGLTSGVAANNSAMTRDGMAQMAFNALTADMVDYPNGTGIDIDLGNGSISMGARAESIKHNSGDALYTGGTAASATSDSVKLCEQRFPTLKLVSTGKTDDFGRPASVWTYNRKDVFTKANAAFVTYTSNMNNDTGKSQIASDLAGYLDGASGVSVVANAGTSTTIDIHENVNALAALTGNGKVVDVYVNNTTVSKVVTSEYQLAQITSKSTVSNSIRLSTGTTVTDKNDNKDYYDILDAMEKDDYVIVALKGANILSLSEPEIVSGAYTKKSGSKYTVGGSEYETSKNTDVTALGTVSGGNFDLYLDSYGYVLLAKAQEGAAKTDAFILAVSRDGSPKTGYTHSAQLLQLDGTVEWVEVSKYDNKDLSTNNTESGYFSNQSTLANKFTKFIVNEDGLYELDAIATDNHKGYVASIDPDVPSVTPNGGSATTANSKTVFLLKQADGSYKSYTGIKNAPKVTGNDTGHTLVESTVAKVVIVGKDGVEVGSEAKYVYFYDATPSIERVGSKTVYTYKAIVDGVDTTVETVIDGTTMSGKLGLYANYSVDGDGYIKSLPADEMAIDGTITNSKLGKAGNIGVKYDGQALTLKVTNNILHVTAKAAADIVKAADANSAATANNPNTYYDVYAADNFVVYRVIEGNKVEVLEAAAETLNVADNVIITLNADGEAAVAYVLGNTALPHVHHFVEKQGVTVKAATCTQSGQAALYICDAEGCDETAGTTWTRSGTDGAYSYAKGNGVITATGHKAIANPGTTPANYVNKWDSSSSTWQHAVKCQNCDKAAADSWTDCSDGSDGDSVCNTCGKTGITTAP